MTLLPFREHHLFHLLHSYDQQQLPLDLVIHRYFRASPALGSKDRGFIAETAYALMRWKGLLDYLDPEASWQSRYAIYSKNELERYLAQEEIPLHNRVSFPKFLFDRLVDSYGKEKAVDLCLQSNQQAPITIRANSLKTDRSSLMAALGDYEPLATVFSSQGITLKKRMNFFQLPQFQQGLFEVQDEGSQLLADLVQAKPGDHLLDYCAGSGGKTLAFAPLTNGKGQIYLHDIRSHALLEAKKRLKRAGIQNSQIIFADSPHLKKLKKKMDWILVDAPCSGTGTLRRNPDMKWKFNEEMLQRLIGQQRIIFEKALSFLRPGGKIVYSTCSLLKEENELQMNHFMATYQLVCEQKPWSSTPCKDGMDGFFGVVLKRS